MIRRIGIVGDTVAGWLVVAAIARSMQRTRVVTLIPDAAPQSPAIAVDADFPAFLALVGLDRAAMDAARRSDRWGTRLHGSDGTMVAFLPSGGASAMPPPLALDPASGTAPRFAAAAEREWRRIGTPGAIFDTRLLAGSLQRHASAMGVVRASAPSAAWPGGMADRDDAIPLADGTTVAVDMIVDARGTPQGDGAAWRDNVVRIGGWFAHGTAPAAAEATLVQKGVSQLLQLFPREWPALPLATEYNRRMASLHAWFADAAALVDMMSRRGHPAISRQLDDRIALFRAGGRLTQAEDDPWPAAAWMSLLLACGIVPRHGGRHDATTCGGEGGTS